jgi:Rrf2 family protein
MLSKKAKYGLKALLYLADQPTDKAVLIAEIAEKEGIPKKFLDMILLEMRNAGMLFSRKGKGGGYALAVPAERIIIGSVIRLLDGPLAPVPCVSKTAYRPCDDCHSEAQCRIRLLMARVRDAMAGILDTTTLADICRSGPARDFVLFYDI